MMKNRFEKVITIGYGWIVFEVIKNIESLIPKYAFDMEYIEHEIHDFNTAKSYCLEKNIPYQKIEDKKELSEYLINQKKNTLIISASNNFLFPAQLLSKENITVINFHNALLPKFPGRNAPSWVIYENEKTTGITWHYVTADVDAGDIIIQKTVDITPDVRAYELADILMHLAFDAFSEKIEEVLCGSAKTTHQEILPERKMYKSREVPGGGVFNIDDDWEYIYRLLRATDYAKYDIFPSVTTQIDGKTVRVFKYKIVENDKAKSGEGFLLYPANDGMTLQIKYKDIV